MHAKRLIICKLHVDVFDCIPNGTRIESGNLDFDYTADAFYNCCHSARCFQFVGKVWQGFPWLRLLTAGCLVRRFTPWQINDQNTGALAVQYKGSIQANGKTARPNGWLQGIWHLCLVLLHLVCLEDNANCFRSGRKHYMMINRTYTYWISSCALLEGVPRTAYHGIVSFYYSNQRVYLAPSSNWKGYDPTWS